MFAFVPSPHNTVDEYVQSFPDPVRQALQSVRERIREVIPEAEERISYGIAGFRLDGKALLYIAGWARHVSMYPVPDGDDALTADTAPFRSGRGTLRFPVDEPIPLDLVGRVAARFRESRRG